MIINFEQQTAELSDQEKFVCEIMTAKLKQNTGIKKAVKSDKIIQYFKDRYEIKLNGARVRKIINYIRIKGLVPCLMATSKGYYVSNDTEELKTYVYSLHQRCAAIRAVAQIIENQIVLNDAGRQSSTGE